MLFFIQLKSEMYWACQENKPPHSNLDVIISPRPTVRDFSPYYDPRVEQTYDLNFIQTSSERLQQNYPRICWAWNMKVVKPKYTMWNRKWSQVGFYTSLHVTPTLAHITFIVFKGKGIEIRFNFPSVIFTSSQFPHQKSLCKASFKG